MSTPQQITLEFDLICRTPGPLDADTVRKGLTEELDQCDYFTDVHSFYTMADPTVTLDGVTATVVATLTHEDASGPPATEDTLRSVFEDEYTGSGLGSTDDTYMITACRVIALTAAEPAP